MRIACWITKVTDTHSEYVIIIAAHCSKCYAEAPEYYVYTRTLRGLFSKLYVDILRWEIQVHLLSGYEELFSATEQIWCVICPQGAPSIPAGRGCSFYRYSTGVSKVTRLCYRPVTEKLTKIIHFSLVVKALRYKPAGRGFDS